MSLATLISLPFIIIIVIFFGATIINIVNHDHVFKPRYSNKHGRSNHNATSND